MSEKFSSGKLFEVGLSLRLCAQSWEPDVTLLGNISAKEIEALASDYARLRLEAGISDDPIKREKQDAIPVEMLDLVRFLAETWDAIDQFVYQHCDRESLMKYPVVQGTRNQTNLRKIGKQPYETKRLKRAVDWLLNAGEGK